MDSKKPLVSIYTLTYNSSKTVLETLESIYLQTYPNIELIVSDDASTDNTLDIKNIKNGMYAQVWHYTDDKDEIEILKIELMKDKPSGS